MSIFKLHKSGGASQYWDDDLGSCTPLTGLAAVTSRFDRAATCADLEMPSPDATNARLLQQHATAMPHGPPCRSPGAPSCTCHIKTQGSITPVPPRSSDKAGWPR
jgi:hypothetical protein